jgi:hypothetical protein
MVDDFWGCPYTGGKVVCDPICKNFVREHFGKEGRPRPSYCRQFGLISKIDEITVVKSEDGVKDGN